MVKLFVQYFGAGNVRIALMVSGMKCSYIMMYNDVKSKVVNGVFVNVVNVKVV